MTSADALSIARDAIIVALKLGAPAMLLALGVGLVISFIQALTQIQEMTLTFVPKMVVILLSLLLFLPFMLSTLTSFTESLMGRIISG
jgi:flagellar biosynthesis protein FliQ